jgi:hypothetical protein
MSSLCDKYTANLLHYLFHKNAIISTMIFLRLNTCIVHINYPHPDKIEDEAPKYMLDLYERFKNNQIAKGSLMGNTVRSIQADIG